MSELLLIFAAASLVNNMVADHLLGVSLATAPGEKMAMALDLALALLWTLPIVVLALALLDWLIISAFQLDAYRLVISVLAVAGVALGAGTLLGRLAPALAQRVERCLPLLVLNCLLLGAILLNAQQEHNLVGALLFGLGSAAGFGLVLSGFTAANARLEATDVPAPFRGLPVQLITLGLIAMAFAGF